MDTKNDWLNHPSKGTSMTKEALKLALEALEHEADKGNDDAYNL